MQIYSRNALPMNYSSNKHGCVKKLQYRNNITSINYSDEI